MHQRLSHLVFTSAVVAAALFPTAVSADQVKLVQRNLNNQRLNELAVWNLGPDNVFEIYTTDVSGNVGCYAADTLEPLWTFSLDGQSLTAPVIGNFMGIGAPVLAFGSSGGTVYFFWPGSGELISKIETDLDFTLAPAVASRSQSDELVMADGKGYVAGFRLNPESGLVQETFRVANTAKDAATFSVIGSMAQPPSCADLNGDGSPEILLTSDTGFLQVISISSDSSSSESRRFHTRITQNTQVTTLAGVGDFTGDGKPVFGYGIDTTLHFFNWDHAGEPNKAIQPAFQVPAYGNSFGHLLVGQLNADAAPDLVSTADSTVAARYMGTDLSGKPAFFDIGPQHLATAKGPFAPAVPVTLNTGAKALVTIDASGTGFIWQPTSEESAQRFSGLPVPTAFSPGGDLTGNGKLSLVIWNEKDFTLSVATLPVAVAPGSEAAPAVTLGANYSRSGQWGSQWNAEWQAKQAASAAALQTAKAALKSPPADDSSMSTDSISIIAGIAPTDPIAKKLRLDKPAGRGVLYTAGGIVILALIIGGGIFLVKRRRP